MFWMCDGDLPYCYQTAETTVLCQIYSKYLRDWSPAFERFMNAKSEAFSSRELRGAALL